MKKIRIISFTEKGFGLSEKMAAVLNEDCQVSLYSGKTMDGGLKRWCEDVFYDSDALIFIGACGIAVRTVAPFLRSKESDPAVLAADEKGKYIISLLSGHLGGGNELTAYLAGRLNANPVITTASDVNGRLAVDVWAKKNQLKIADMRLAKAAAAQIVSGALVPFFCEGSIAGTIPEEFQRISQAEADTLRTESGSHDDSTGKREGIALRAASSLHGDPAGKSGDAALRKDAPVEPAVAVSIHTGWKENVLRLIPRAVVLGIGCKKGKTAAEIVPVVERLLNERGIAKESVARMASIDLKAEEAGLCAMAEAWRIPFVTFSTEVLNKMPGIFAGSDFVQETTGVDNVCERAAVAALDAQERETAEFICRKTAADGVTVALVCRKWGVSFE